MKRLLFCVITCCLFAFPQIVNAQSHLEQFTSIQSQGVKPDDFQLVMKDHQLDINYLYLKNIFQSGELIYGSEINNYLNTIIDNLLRDYPEIRPQIRCYLLRSTEVNAYATSSGIIFVNMGLIAQVTNESELAFVLAHEIAHYVEKHIYQLQDYRNNNRSGDVKSSYLKYHNRSRETEMEADKLALERYFKNTSYSFRVIDGVFDVLQYNYLPFDEIPFKREYIETDFYQFPESHYLTTLNPIKSREDYIDTLHTHPNIKRRREHAKSITENMSEEGRSAFVQPESLFKKVQELARFECINTFLTYHEYDNAIYNIYVLQQKYPNNFFLKKAMVCAFYGLFEHKNKSSLTDVLPNHKNIEGEKQQVNHIFGKLTRAELNVLTLRFLWDAYQESDKDPFLYEMCQRSVEKLVTLNKMTPINFSDYPMGTNLKDIEDEVEEVADTTTVQAGNKYQRIKQQVTTQTKKVKPDDKFRTVNYMLVDLKQDEAFMKLIEEAIRKKEDAEVHAFIATKKASVKIENLIVFEPFYAKSYTAITKSDVEKHFIDTEKSKQKLGKTIDYSLKKLKFNTSLYYSTERMANMNTEEYNHFCKLQLWRTEYIYADGVPMLLYQCNDIDDVCNALGSDKVSMIVMVQKPISFITYRKIEALLYGAITLPILPVSVAAFMLPRCQTQSYFNMVNLKSGLTEKSASISVNSELKQAHTNAFIYDMFYKIRKGK